MPNMPKKSQTVDARGLSCPQPVLDTKRALDAAAKNDVAEVTVLVDTVTARENVKRFAQNAGWQTTDTQIDDHFKVILKR